MKAPRRARRFWAQGQRGWPERYPLAQFPNAPLLVALGGGLVATRTSGSTQTASGATFYAALLVWAWEELTGGVNLVRRAVGASGLAYIAVQLLQRFRRGLG